MRECSNCGASVREGAKFCTSCGTRLNDAAPASQINSWALPDNDATVVAPAVTSSEEVDVSMSSDAVPNQDPEPDEAMATAGADGFAWSWGSAASTSAEEGPEGDDGSAPPPVDDGDAAVAPSLDDTVVDVVADDTTVSDESDAIPTAGDQEPVADRSTAESLDASDNGDDATLAAWAGQWSDDETTQASYDTTQAIDVTMAALAEDGIEGQVNDPVARAEQLLDELKRIIPSLAQPRVFEQGATAEGNPGLLSAAAFMDDLGDTGDDDSFDDLRNTIEAAQANPRDVDSMLKLAANAERLRALLDDRNRLAGKLNNIRERLREQVPDSENSGDA